MPSHEDLSNWYAQVGQYLEAGALISDALRLCEGMPERGRIEMAERLEAGEPFSAVMASAPKWLPRDDRQFMLAGMETGSLPLTLQNLSARHASIGATQVKLLFGLAYPIGVLHIAALLLPVTQMIDYEHGVQWNLAKYLLEATLMIIPIWAVIGAVIYLVRSNSRLLPPLLRLLPILHLFIDQVPRAESWMPTY